jgi:hypothetical protein
MTEEELAAIERQHGREEGLGILDDTPLCSCGEPWPCAATRLLAAVRDLREVERAIEQRIAIGLDDLAMLADQRPPADLHPADKLAEYLVPWAAHEIERLRALLCDLADVEPLALDQNQRPYCLSCGKNARWSDRTDGWAVEHDADCPWTTARAAL